MEQTLTIDLVPPVTWSAQTFDKLELREPTIGEVTKAFSKDAGLVASTILVSLVTGIPRGAIENVPMSKFKAAADFLGTFTQDTPATSET